ncbi:TPR domain protein [Aspergillus lentulus]|uniref:TPR domain protein n=1 Tax=Aspergillus lentulus TaxID=293939 RepID=A0ABQ0ZVS0_ASPLE|nr:TPR domain protein [Aspergillus lentulus]
MRMQTAIQASYIFSSTSLRDRRHPLLLYLQQISFATLFQMQVICTTCQPIWMFWLETTDGPSIPIQLLFAQTRSILLERFKSFYSFYRPHNYQSLIYAAILAGQSKVAMKVLNDMEASITDDVLRIKSPPLADWMEFFKAVRVHVYTRFGTRKETINLPLPLDQDLYCVTTVMTHYGKGIAHAAMGNIAEAEQERELYRAAAKRVPPTRKDFPNLIVDVLEIATAMLDAEIQYRRGNFTSAFEYLREAIRHDDSLLYMEPWGWLLPTRHAYAALSLEQGHVEEALRAYAEDSSLTRAQ